MRVVETDVLDIATEEDGPADGRPALLVHGSPDAPRGWAPVAERLHARGWRTIAQDPIGFARVQWDTWSPPGWFDDDEPRDPRYEALARRLADVGELATPTLMVQGGDDRCDEPSGAEGQERWFTGGYRRLLLDGIGHFPHREAPDAVARARRAPLTGAGPRRGHVSACPGCGLRLPSPAAPAQPSLAASPACWALYERALERAYSDPVCRDVLQLVVDAYACQHPGQPGRRSAQSVALSLMTLCLFLEEGADPREGSRLHARMVAHAPFAWLDPPPRRGELTVAAVADAQSAAAYADAAWAWARDVWHAWACHHETVRAWIPRSHG